MRKEYNDRWTAPLVNPGFTMPEYEKSKAESALDEFVEKMKRTQGVEIDSKPLLKKES